jgi:hypothetical protein
MGTADGEPMAPARGGGIAGNERLTGSTAAVLVVLLFVEGVTILSLDSLMPLHVLVGIALIPPVLLKLASTGYRLARYYTGDAAYVRRGPPPTVLRLLGPVVALSTIAVIGSGIALLLAGPGNDVLGALHRASFIVFFAATAVHVLAHAAKVPRQTVADWRRRTRLPGASFRRLAVVASLVVGIALGAAAIAYDGSWVHRHHHRTSARP